MVAATLEGSSHYYVPKCKPLSGRKRGNGVLESVTAAVHKLGGTITAGDISVETGLTIQEAETALADLVAATGGTLQVEIETLYLPDVI